MWVQIHKAHNVGTHTHTQTHTHNTHHTHTHTHKYGHPLERKNFTPIFKCLHDKNVEGNTSRIQLTGGVSLQLYTGNSGGVWWRFSQQLFCIVTIIDTEISDHFFHWSICTGNRIDQSIFYFYICSHHGDIRQNAQAYSQLDVYMHTHGCDNSHTHTLSHTHTHTVSLTHPS